jgi:hypothetical protein
VSEDQDIDVNQLVVAFAKGVMAVVERAERRGEERGRKAERERLTSALPAFLESFQAGETEAATRSVNELFRPRVERLKDDDAQVRGSIAQAVRTALKSMPLKEGGFEAQDIVDFSRFPLKVDQVRSVLKVLERNGEARRVARGKYFPPRILRPGPDASTSDPAQ